MVAQVITRIDTGEELRHRRRLYLQESPHVFRRELLISIVTHRQRRCDVEHGGLLHCVEMIQAKAMEHPSAAIMAGHHEGSVVEIVHDVDNVL